MSNGYQINIRKEMAFSIQLGNNGIEVTGEEIEAPYINVAGTDAINISNVFYEIEEADKLFLRIKPELETDGNQVYKLHIPGSWQQIFSIETNNGKVNLNTLKGVIKVQTSHGHIKLKDLTGSITVQCATGAIEGENITGTVDLSTSNGKVAVKNSFLEGGSIKTNNGKMEIQANLAATGNLSLFAGNGELDLALPGTGDYLVKIQTKEKFDNHLKDCSIINDNEITTVRMGEGNFTIMVINFKGGVRLMEFKDFGKDWNKKETWGFEDFKLPDPAQFLHDLLNRDYSKDIPDILKKLSDFGSQFGKMGEELTKKFNQFSKANSRDDEIKIVLDMLQEGKISTEDAEKLINAIKKK